MSIHAVVGSREYSRHSFVLWFGACAPTQVLVYADSLEDALEDAAAALRDHGWNGLFTDPDYQEAFQDLQQDGEIPQDVTWDDIATCGMIDDLSTKVLEAAEADITYTESGYIASWEWGLVFEDPTKQQLLELGHDRCYMWHGVMRHEHPMAARHVPA